jgi:hypothetical protein
MLVFYLISILYIYYYYDYNKSISNLICNEDYKKIILFFMLLMGICTLLYEIERCDTISIFLISIMLISIYGLIFINETNIIHYIFAFCVFIVILLFMGRHCYLANNNILLLSFFLEILILLYIIIQINDNIFYIEIFYILNFAFFYIYLHFSQYITY